MAGLRTAYSFLCYPIARPPRARALATALKQKIGDSTKTNLQKVGLHLRGGPPSETAGSQCEGEVFAPLSYNGLHTESHAARLV